MTPQVSVIIATRNRSHILPETLHALAAQDTDGLTFDALVIDNGSSDDTRAVIDGWRGRFPVPLRYAYEPRVGKAHALNLGLGLAAGQVFAFTDDDTDLSPRWLISLYGAMVEHKADGAGGPVAPRWRGEQPAWLSPSLLRQLGVAEYGQSAFIASSDKHPFIGGNCAYHRQLFTDYGGFSVTDPAEDCEWFHRMRRAGRRLVYQPTALVWHMLDATRLTPWRLSRRLFHQGRGYAMRRLGHEAAGRHIAGIPRWVVREYVAVHGQGLRHAASGRWQEALWCWFQRDIYHGMIVQCLADRRRLRGVRTSAPTIRTAS